MTIYGVLLIAGIVLQLIVARHQIADHNIRVTIALLAGALLYCAGLIYPSH